MDVGNIGGVYGVYGTQGVSSPSNVPGSRDSSISWIDLNGTLWLFGGVGFAAAGNYGKYI